MWEKSRTVLRYSVTPHHIMSDPSYIIKTARPWRTMDREDLQPHAVARGLVREKWVADKDRKCYVLRGRPLTAEEFSEIMSNKDLLASFNQLLRNNLSAQYAQLWTVEIVPGEKEERKTAAKDRAAKREAALERIGE